MAPVIMGNRDRPELSAELANSFCRTDPEIAKHFAHVTFLSDNRADMPQVTSLRLYCSAPRTRSPRYPLDTMLRSFGKQFLRVDASDRSLSSSECTSGDNPCHEQYLGT